MKTVKAYIWFALLTGAMLLASCSKEEDVDEFAGCPCTEFSAIFNENSGRQNSSYEVTWQRKVCGIANGTRMSYEQGSVLASKAPVCD